MFDALSSSAAPAQGAAPPQPVRAPGFAAELRSEIRRLVHPPRDDLSILAGNALLVCAGWFLLPPAARDWLFDLHGRLAFAVVLQTWMLADTPATNLLGNDVAGALAAIPDQRRLRRLLRVKVTALACVVGAVGAAASVALAARDGRWAAGAATAALMLTLPFGTAAVSSWLGVVLPYHRRSLRWRWAHRRLWRRHLRWAALVVIPYTAVPVLYGALVGPAALAAADMHRRDHHHHLTGPSLLVGAIIACLFAVAVYVVGSHAGAWMATRRARSLQTYLADPDLG